MSKLIGVIILIFISGIGFLRIICKMKGQIEYSDFAVKYLNEFREFSRELMNKFFDDEKYQWLKLNSVKMQTIIGDYVEVTYKPPAANFVYKNYQVIVNGITEIKNMYIRMINGFSLSLEKEMLLESIELVDDVLLTYISYLQKQEEELTKELKNPFVWFREGVRFIVTFPIFLVHWSGLIRYNTYSRISNNIIIKVIAFMVGIITLFSSIVTIVTGYIPFINIINDFLNNNIRK